MSTYLYASTLVFQFIAVLVIARAPAAGVALFVTASLLQGLVAFMERKNNLELETLKSDMEAIKSALSGVMIQAGKTSGY